MVRMYTKKPVTIEAIQFLGEVNSNDCYSFIEGKEVEYPASNEIGVITPEGHMRVRIGDYIIKGIKGEFYPCRADIFEETYTPDVIGIGYLGRLSEQNTCIAPSVYMTSGYSVIPSNNFSSNELED